ncbi:MAG: diaminopimelate epimerase [Clostridia bacterium]|jgi:diaminopimelate epimerase|nr:diaminopimelate epimerase [Clostridia bacterium]
MQFTKVHGLGNDFIIINTFKESIKNPNELAVKLCHRHFGVGADGLVLVGPSDKADIKMRIFNPDGSEPEMCGNAIRCVAKYAFTRGMCGEKIKVETLAGIMGPEVILDGDEITGIKVDMGEPHLEREAIPMEGPSGQVVSEPLKVDDQEFLVTAVSMGNPHCVIYVDDASKVKLEGIGPKIEHHQAFPAKTNVEFVQVLNENEVKMLVWERGAGPTMACGTGACAVTVAGVLNEKHKRKIKVHLTGGTLEIHWSEEDNHVYMTGPAEEVFEGTLKNY